MPCPHYDINIIQRSNRQSAVAAAAYQSGERLFSEYDGEQKYYSYKGEIVHKEIMLPPHAPPAKDEERIDVLEKLVMRLYEDMVAGRVSETNFQFLMEKTQKEQKELKERADKTRRLLNDEIQLADDAQQWIESIQEYRDITELDTATLNRLIKEIIVHEAIDDDKTRHISIVIHFNLKPLPEVELVTA